ncbi:MAG: hypothetical protein RQ859_01015 [Pyrobaculum sp.]|jgi:hypothetical protein|nr:hypothetical protein [Pyrobaculum sp.]
MLLETVFGLQVTWTSALTYSILALAAGYQIFKILTRQEPIETVLGEVIKEVVITAVVASAVLYWSQELINIRASSPQAVVDQLQSVAQEAYLRTVKIAQCIANIRLSGPLSAYAGYAEAKFGLYIPLYEQAVWMYNQLAGLARFLAEYGGLAVSLGLAIYAAAARRIGGIVIGAVLGLWIALAILAAAAAGQIKYCATQKIGKWGGDFHPFLDRGCDDDLLHSLKEGDCTDYAGWQLVVAYAWLFLFIAPAVSLAVGYLLGS